MPRALLLRLLDHPSPPTAAFQRCVMLVLIDTALILTRLGRRLSR